MDSINNRPKNSRSGLRDKPIYLLHVLGSKSTKYGGLEKWILRLALSLENHNVKLILCYNSEPQSTLFLDKLRECGIPYFVADSSKPISFAYAFFTNYLKYRPVLVHAHFQPLFTLLYSYLMGCRHRFYSVRLMLLKKDLTEAEQIGQLKAKQQFYLPVLNFFATKMLAVSNAVMEQYISVFKNTVHKFRVIYNGVSENSSVRSVAREKLKFLDNRIYVGCVGFDSSIKGIDILIEAANMLKKNHESLPIEFCIIGLDDSSQYTSGLKRQVTMYGLNNHFVWYGIINNVPVVLAALDIYCQPSRTEALPNAVMEAGLAGLPSVGSNVGGMKEVIVDNVTGYLFEREDAAQLADYLSLLCRDREGRNAMGFAARKHMEDHFNSDVSIEKMVNLYLGAIN